MLLSEIVTLVLHDPLVNGSAVQGVLSPYAAVRYGRGSLMVVASRR